MWSRNRVIVNDPGSLVPTCHHHSSRGSSARLLPANHRARTQPVIHRPVSHATRPPWASNFGQLETASPAKQGHSPADQDSQEKEKKHLPSTPEKTSKTQVGGLCGISVRSRQLLIRRVRPCLFQRLIAGQSTSGIPPKERMYQTPWRFSSHCRPKILHSIPALWCSRAGLPSGGREPLGNGRV